MLKTILFVPDFVFGASGNYNTGLVDFLEHGVRLVNASRDEVKDPAGHLVPGSGSNSGQVCYYSLIESYDQDKVVQRCISKTDVYKLAVLDKEIKTKLGLPASGLPVIPNSPSNVLNYFIKDDVSPFANEAGVAQFMQEVILSDKEKPYELFVRSDTIYVVVRAGFANLLIAYREYFTTILLADIVRKYRGMYGLKALYNSDLFRTFMLNKKVAEM